MLLFLLLVVSPLFVVGDYVKVANRLQDKYAERDVQKAQLYKGTNSNLDKHWLQYKQTHNKLYTPEEEVLRRAMWEKRVQEIQAHNLEYDLGLHTYTMGINEYSDLTPVEYSKYLLGFRAGPRSLSGAPFPLRDLDVALPDTVDWRDKGYVTPVKNQGQCGSCWAFSATGALEGAHYKTTGKLVSLSEQNLVDCTTGYGNAGCNGGWMDNAFRYVQENNGIDTEAHYPYEAHDDRCDYSADPAFKGSNCTGHVHVTQGSEADLQKAVALIGPVSVAIDATQSSFGQYRSGVYDEPKCSNTTTDHAVLVVGYGTHNGLPYWLVKNSWGESWGDQGYIMMSRNKLNQCAIALYASYPLA